MVLFKHPHLVRGIVHTPHGAFTINRGLAVLPEEVGDALGWHRLDDEPQPVPGQGRVVPTATGSVTSPA